MERESVKLKNILSQGASKGGREGSASDPFFKPERRFLA